VLLFEPRWTVEADTKPFDWADLLVVDVAPDVWGSFKVAFTRFSGGAEPAFSLSEPTLWEPGLAV